MQLTPRQDVLSTFSNPFDFPCRSLLVRRFLSSLEHTRFHPNQNRVYQVCHILPGKYVDKFTSIVIDPVCTECPAVGLEYAYSCWH